MYHQYSYLTYEELEVQVLKFTHGLTPANDKAWIGNVHSQEYFKISNFHWLCNYTDGELKLYFHWFRNINLFIKIE
jgi:hypothetical protein